MPANITEIISRSTQGITRPFLCRADDGRQFFVKGNGAGRRALICEWLAGKLGQKIGLPIPTFVQAAVPSELVQFSARDDIQDLGAGTGFGSQLVENVDELAYLFIEQIDAKLRAKILLFDWWICNNDRTLTEEGGNVNLLWSHRDSRLHVIDQNLAFDPEGMDGFWDNHVFRDSLRDWTPGFRDEMQTTMRTALTDLERWWNEMPESWTDVDAGVVFRVIEKLLWRFDADNRRFWRTA
jgi:hypothetical protein